MQGDLGMGLGLLPVKVLDLLCSFIPPWVPLGAIDNFQQILSD